MPKKLKKKNTRSSKKTNGAGKETFMVSTIWKNQFQYGPQKGRNYWTLVLEDGSRVPCYDPNAISEFVDLDERRTQFDPPKELKLFVDMTKDKTRIISDPSKAKEKKGTSYAQSGSGRYSYPSKSQSGKSPEEIKHIARTSAVYGAVDFLEYQKVKTLEKLKEVIEVLESYISTGKF